MKGRPHEETNGESLLINNKTHLGKDSIGLSQSFSGDLRGKLQGILKFFKF